MAWKRLGAADLAATTNTDLYTPGADTETICNVNLCNRSAGEITVRIAIAATTVAPTDAEYVEYEYALAAAGGKDAVLERTGIHINTGHIIVVRASAVGVSATCWGNERSTA